jgi:hypothetical protein
MLSTTHVVATLKFYVFWHIVIAVIIIIIIIDRRQLKKHKVSSGL